MNDTTEQATGPTIEQTTPRRRTSLIVRTAGNCWRRQHPRFRWNGCANFNWASRSTGSGRLMICGA
jgi:hypothetical protein